MNIELERESREYEFTRNHIHNEYENYFTARMFLENGSLSAAVVITDQITFSSDDPVLNMVASKLSLKTEGILIVNRHKEFHVYRFKGGVLKKLKD